MPAIIIHMRKKLSLHAVLMTGMVGLLSITVILIAVSTFVSSKKVFLSHAKDIMENIASYTIDKSLNHLKPANDAAQLTSSLADNKIVTSDNITAMEQYFYEQLRLYPQFSNIYFGKTNGEFIMASRDSQRAGAQFFTKIISFAQGTRNTRMLFRNADFDLVGTQELPDDTYDPRKRPWYLSASQKKELIWTDPYVFFTSQKPGITTASPVFDENGELRGVVGVDIGIDELSLFIANLKIGKTGRAFILHENGDVIAFHDLSKLTHKVNNGESLRLVSINELDDKASRVAYQTLVSQHPKRERSGRQFVSFVVDNRVYHGMFAPFNTKYWPWSIGVYLPEEDYIGALNENLQGNITIALLLAVVSSFIGWFIASSIIRSVQQIEKGVQLIRENDFHTPLYINSVYKEIQDTGDSFSVMRKELESYSTNMENLVKSRTADLHKAVEEAKRANDAKSAFLANISHEIRTPLNGIMGFAELIQATHTQPNDQSYAATIIQESERLLLLINQLLDISKIESGKLVLEKHIFELSTVFDAMKKTFEKEIEKKGIRYITDIGDMVPSMVYGDSLRLSQILLNLLSNAFKFTDSGSVTLSCHGEPTKTGDVVLHFSIADTGIGISQDKQDMIFESFTQADPSISRKYGGTGLGISIARELIQLMGGYIRLESTPGEGTVFSFSVIMKRTDQVLQPKQPSAGEQPEFSLEGKSVLIVEDYSVNRDILVGFLHLLKANVLSAEDGFEALELYNENQIDLILMDVHMPGLNGIETTKRIREMGDHSTPIIGVTAHAFQWELEKCIEAGMNSTVTKPFRRKKLFATIESCLTGNYGESSGSPAQEEDGAGTDPLKLLIEELGGNIELGLSIRKEFFDGLPESLEAIATSWEQRNFKESHRIAHSLGSGAGNIFEQQLMETLRELESFLKPFAQNKTKDPDAEDDGLFRSKLSAVNETIRKKETDGE